MLLLIRASNAGRSAESWAAKKLSRPWIEPLFVNFIELVALVSAAIPGAQFGSLQLQQLELSSRT